MLNNLTLLMSGGDKTTQNGYMQFLPLVLIIIVFYFFMIRPQMKKQKEAKKFLEEIKKGDKIVTIGGIHAKIHEVHDTHYIIEVSENVKLKISKSAVSMDGSVAITTQ